jgi:hypothetical protein
MDDSQARILLSVERARVEELLHDLRRNRRADRLATGEQGDMSDSTESFVARTVIQSKVACSFPTNGSKPIPPQSSRWKKRSVSRRHRWDDVGLPNSVVAWP